MNIKKFLSNPLVKILIFYDIVLLLLLLFVFSPVFTYADELESESNSIEYDYYVFNRYGLNDSGFKVDGYISVPHGTVPVLVDGTNDGGYFSVSGLYLISDSGFTRVSYYIDMVNKSGNKYVSTDVDRNISTVYGDVHMSYSFDLSSPYGDKAFYQFTFDKKNFSESFCTIPWYSGLEWLSLQENFYDNFEGEYYTSFDELQQFLEKSKYDSPKILRVESLLIDYDLTSITNEEMIVFTLDNNNADSLSGSFTINCTDVSGNDYSHTFDIESLVMGNWLSYVGKNLPPVQYDSSSNKIYLQFDELDRNFKSFGYPSLSINSIDIKMKYQYGKFSSNESYYKYSLVDGSLEGAFYDSSVKDFIASDDIQNNDSQGIHNTDFGFLTTIQDIVDFFSESLSQISLSISKVFNSLKTLFTSSSSFIKFVGNIYSALLGSSLGSFLIGGLLIAVVLRFLGR